MNSKNRKPKRKPYVVLRGKKLILGAMIGKLGLEFSFAIDRPPLFSNAENCIFELTTNVTISSNLDTFIRNLEKGVHKLYFNLRERIELIARSKRLEASDYEE